MAGMAGLNIGALPMNPALVAAALNQVNSWTAELQQIIDDIIFFMMTNHSRRKVEALDSNEIATCRPAGALWVTCNKGVRVGRRGAPALSTGPSPRPHPSLPR